MTYAMGESLQMAVYSRLAGDPGLDDLIHGAVFDAVPERAPDLFVAMGPEQARAQSDVSGACSIHDIQLSVVTTREGYLAAKSVAGRVSDALSSSALTLTRGRVVSLRFLRARARRDKTQGTRRIDMWFRAHLDEELI
ncbi:MAG: DUF3168 domain-containing protein [Pseudomonadota bacterium]